MLGQKRLMLLVQSQLQSDSAFSRSINNVRVPPIFGLLQNRALLGCRLRFLCGSRSKNDSFVLPLLLFAGHREMRCILSAHVGLLVVRGLVLERLVVALVEDAVACRLRFLGFLDVWRFLMLQLEVDLLFEAMVLLRLSAPSQVNVGEVVGCFVVIFGDVENLVV